MSPTSKLGSAITRATLRVNQSVSQARAQVAKAAQAGIEHLNPFPNGIGLQPAGIPAPLTGSNSPGRTLDDFTAYAKGGKQNVKSTGAQGGSVEGLTLEERQAYESALAEGTDPNEALGGRRLTRAEKKKQEKAEGVRNSNGADPSGKTRTRRFGRNA